ncbi:SDR family oxidoreductase [Thalassoroseus pseudoceratinae]|uniref:SDR family oxidoreductase n=1 Tax=Thalassoroseus pseudoceratinae TaxID=2713176 RepID=UPI0014236E17|nr:SDR family oxidoreductase [Thalassoroseus pseudoceratinae]
MDVKNKVVVVTGGARGIGAALCRQLAAAGAKVMVSDVDETTSAKVAEEIGGASCGCDVSREDEVVRLVAATEKAFGPVDIFVSNAGITVKGGEDTIDGDWQRLWDVNVMSRIFAARAVVPGMLERGEGYLIHTASAAGLLTEIGSAAYSVTKHADVALAEWLSVQHGREGIRVSCVCPLGVETDMLDPDDPIHQFLQISSISADQAATAIMQGIESEKFLILPHPQVEEFYQMKSEDPDRWIRGMQRLKQKLARRRAA